MAFSMADRETNFDNLGAVRKASARHQHADEMINVMERVSVY